MINLNKKTNLALLLLAITLFWIVLLFRTSNDQTNPTINKLQSLVDGQNITSIINNTKFDLEVARSLKARAKGLMSRQDLADKAGMLFVFDEPSILNFYMKNTFIPLDIIFIDQDLKVINIHKNTKPLNPEILYSSTKPAPLVIELIAGSTEMYQILPGSDVRFAIE